MNEMIEGLTEEEAVKKVMEAFGYSEIQTRFFVAISRGEIEGDEVVFESLEEAKAAEAAEALLE